VRLDHNQLGIVWRAMRSCHWFGVPEHHGESQISLTDPDSRAMTAHTKVAVGYNIQVAVDTKNKMIVEQAVTNQVVDMGLLKETAEPARAILDIEACEKAGLTPHVPKPQRGSSVNGLFRKDESRYDPDRGVYGPAY
jgi:hypothetical protein